MLFISRYRISIVALAVALGLTIGFFAHIGSGFAKEFDVLGTLECGQPSGQPCPQSDHIVIWTTAISGVRQEVVVDVSWIRPQLEQAPNKQDDLLCLLVEEVPGVGYRGLMVMERCEDLTEDEDNEEEKRRDQRNDDAA